MTAKQDASDCSENDQRVRPSGKSCDQAKTMVMPAMMVTGRMTVVGIRVIVGFFDDFFHYLGGLDRLSALVGESLGGAPSFAAFAVGKKE